MYTLKYQNVVIHISGEITPLRDRRALLPELRERLDDLESRRVLIPLLQTGYCSSP
jgi:hypothetical protein